MLNNNIKNIVRDSFNNLYDGESYVSIAIPLSTNFSSNLENELNKSNLRFFHWTQISVNYSFTAIDSIFDISINGNNRLSKSAEQINDLKVISNWKEYNLNNIPLFAGGIKFTQDNKSTIWSDYSDSDWFLPKFVLLTLQERNFIIFNFSPKDNFENVDLNFYSISNLLINIANCSGEIIHSLTVASFDSEVHERIAWTNKVNEALDKIDKGLAQKIVLSREVVLSLETDYCISPILNYLKTKFKRCYIFAYKKNGSIFFGASPERLAKINNGWIEADALAGSIKRGASKEEDDMLAESLLKSQKNLLEQKAVVDFIANSFNSFSDEVVFEQFPSIRKLENIQHLWTNIKAKLNSEYSIFELLKEIHPTPAICGVPWNNALQFIKELEEHSRGLFAGVIGWFNFEQEAEFAVAIRSAIIKNDELHAFAGCGIVKGSDPFDEFEETKLKLSAILSSLNHDKIYQS